MKTPPKTSAKRTQRAITIALVRSALAAIPPDLEREKWVRLAMAIKSELGNDGFHLWNAWSNVSPTYNERDAADVWRSVRAGGTVKIGTLLMEAKRHGFQFPDDGEVQAPALAGMPAAVAEQEQLRAAEERKQQRQVDEEAFRDRAKRAGLDAARMWDHAKSAGSSPYLERKGVRAHGIKFSSDGTLLVPMRDVDGTLHSVQRISPAGEKRFKAGAKKAGLHHWIGEPVDGQVLLLAEGYATAATLHEATGFAAAVCFDGGNLASHVAAAVRMRFPDAQIMICGDDDRETEQRTGKNPGRSYAASAVRAVNKNGGRAAAAFPSGLPASGSDFNDLAMHAGAAAVKAQIEQAIALMTAQTPREAAKTAPGAPIAVAEGSGAPVLECSAPAVASPRGAADGEPEVFDDAAAFGHDLFTVDRAGVWFSPADDKKPMWICSPLLVTARTSTEDGNGWGYLLEFSDPDGKAKVLAMPSSLLSGEGSEWAGMLRDRGLRIAPGGRARNLVAQYIDTRNVRARVTCTDRVGWHGPVYVLPSSSICSAKQASDGRRYVFQSDSAMEDTFRRHGTLADWRTHVSGLAIGNSRIAFAIACAFAGPMLRLAGMESGGFHFRGDSSVGKTTSLKVAASVWGRPSYMQRWRTTDNALESTACQHSDCTLILDEFGQLDPKVAGDCAYMLANDQEKGRATRGGLLRRKRTWRLLFLSSGEVSLADHMAEGGKRTRAGMEVRMVDVPLEAGAGMGGIETLHGFPTPAQLADGIVSAAARFYGTPGRALLEWACERTDSLPGRLEAMIASIRSSLVPSGASEQVGRVASRFALVAAAGELATEADITGWVPGEATVAAKSCFTAWLGARGHLHNGEDAAMMRCTRQFLEINGEGRFSWLHRSMDDHSPKTLNRAGFRRLLGADGRPVRSDSDHQREFGERIGAADAEVAHVDYIILREVFEREVCRGFDPKAVAQLLKRRGHLQAEGDRLLDRQRLPGMGGEKVPCYHIKPSIFSDDL